MGTDFKQDGCRSGILSTLENRAHAAILKGVDVLAC